MKLLVVFLIGFIFGFYGYSLLDEAPSVSLRTLYEGKQIQNHNVQGTNKWWDEVVFDGTSFTPSSITINRSRMLGILNQQDDDQPMILESDYDGFPSGRRVGSLEYVSVQLLEEGEFTIWFQDDRSNVLRVKVRSPEASVAN